MGNQKATAFEQLKFGQKIKNIGDFNKDGFEDWAILSYDGCYANIYFGGDVFDYDADIRILLPQDSYAKCHDMAVGDLNADGWDDIVISNSSNSEVGWAESMTNDRENIFIFFGSSDMPNVLSHLNASVILEDSGTFYSFGNNLAIIGDYNADGFNDLVVGGGKHKSCLREAFVYLGGEQISNQPDIVISVPCTSCGISFASPITSCGDINNDGYDDFALGDSDNEHGQSLLYFGGPLADSLFDLAIVNPTGAGSKFGRNTPKIQGDYTGDGYPDLIHYNYYTGEFFVYKGGPEFDDEPDYILSDTSVSVYLSSIEFLKDFSTEGRSDLIVSDYSNAGDLLLFFGCAENKQNADLIFKNNLLRTAGIASGDFNNDDYTDVFVGNPFEPNYGCSYGGIVQHFISPFQVNIEDILNEKGNNLLVFPNPSHSFVNLIYKSQHHEKLIINIIDVNGKTIMQSNNFSNQVIEINLEGLPYGFYIIHVLSDRSSMRKKILKIGN